MSDDVQKDDRDMRFNALQLAHFQRAEGERVEETVKRAEAFYRFISQS